MSRRQDSTSNSSDMRSCSIITDAGPENRCRSGEIDIIAKDGETLVFCEVKYRSDGAMGSPLEAVDVKKQRTIFRSALYYLSEHGLEDVPCRFDVIGIEGAKITQIRNAFFG